MFLGLGTTISDPQIMWVHVAPVRLFQPPRSLHTMLPSTPSAVHLLDVIKAPISQLRQAQAQTARRSGVQYASPKIGDVLVP
ncbi:hypothetical protein M404DRAFT_432391 [Pisolithus tinctorius Marx 270]|uniref:Uncharacterized protein n=1 Tax=Pisolithus tinctorius Marx 270 TaxID=870435 RepID=A0A0C3NEL5_PISTI|nr:hypothetical protein M404DRAFT_432391 [Pisolithus tinctorius Marx 270]